MAINMTFVDFVTPVPADWLNNVNTVVNTPALTTYTAPYTGAVSRSNQSKFSDSISVLDFGADPTGVADSTTAINTANTAAFNAKKALYIPGGTYLVSGVTLSAPVVYGDGPQGGTTIKGTSASAHTLTVQGGSGTAGATTGVLLQNLNVISSIPAASRTGAGVFIQNSNVYLSHIYSNGHLYGFWNQGNGNEFDHCFGIFNKSHGIFLDGSVLPQNEIGVFSSEFNVNGGDGIRLSTAGQGQRFVSVTAATNTGAGFQSLSGVTDTWLINPEISTNGTGIVFAAGTSDIQITNPFIESSSVGANLIINGALVSVAGGFIQACSAASPNGGGVLLGGSDINMSAVEISGNKGFGIHLAASSVNVNLSAIEISNTAASGQTTTTALIIDAGAGPFTWAGGDCSGIATPLLGTLPTGTLINAVRGLTNYQTGTANVTTSAAYGSLFVGAATITLPTTYVAGYLPKMTANVASTAGGGIAAEITSFNNGSLTVQVIGVTNGGVVPIIWQSN